MNEFKAIVYIIGINPFVFVPEAILNNLFIQAAKTKGPIPVCGKVNEVEYRQTLLRYRGEWRLYINMEMLPNSPKRIGETIVITIEYDPKDRAIPIHPKLAVALKNDREAKNVFDHLTPSLRKEINRHLSFLKTEKSITHNVSLAIGFLKGENKFIGRNTLKK